jgi:hypothetical protein
MDQQGEVREVDSFVPGQRLANMFRVLDRGYPIYSESEPEVSHSVYSESWPEVSQCIQSPSQRIAIQYIQSPGQRLANIFRGLLRG